MRVAREKSLDCLSRTRTRQHRDNYQGSLNSAPMRMPGCRSSFRPTREFRKVLPPPGSIAHAILSAGEGCCIRPNTKPFCVSDQVGCGSGVFLSCQSPDPNTESVCCWNPGDFGEGALDGVRHRVRDTAVGVLEPIARTAR